MINLEVCVGSACHLKGSYSIINIFQKLIDDNDLQKKVTLKACFCLGHCTKPVSVRIDNDKIYSVSSENAEKFFKDNIMGRL